MNLDTYVPPVREDGDRLPTKELAGRPLIVVVREHLMGVKTQFNSDPADALRYKPEGGEAVKLDVADLTTNSVYINVMWFNGAIVDSLKSFVASTLPVKLFYDTPKRGGNPYINVEPLVGAELAGAQAWAAANATRFETERAARAAQATSATNGVPPIPGAPAGPPAWAALVNPVMPPHAMPASPPPQPVAPPAPVVNTPAPAVDVNDPAIQALLATIAAQQQAAG
jgi:hypothetical protein